MKLRVGLVMVICVVSLAVGAGAASAAGPFTVNDPTDAPLATPGDTTCTSTNHVNGAPTCTLRAAVQAADNMGGSSTINLPDPSTLMPPATAYTLSVASTAPDDPSNGDFDITNTVALSPTAVTITGAGAGSTIIDPKQIDRAFAVDAGASLALSGVTVRNGAPSTTSTGSPNGGAIYSVGALTLTNDVFASNNGGSAGGAIDLGGTAPATITNDTFTGNTAPVSAVGGGGGAVYVGTSGASTFNHDEFDGNQTLGSGGAVYQGATQITADGSSFVSNIAAGNGGGIFDLSGRLSLTNATLSGNEANVGGGLAASSGVAVDLINDTVTGNAVHAGGFGGGTSLPGAVSATVGVGIVNTIIAENTGGDCQQSLTTIDTAGHNLDGDGSCFTGSAAVGDLTGVNPQLSSPAHHGGGPVQTDAELPGSPAIDAGTTAHCPTPDPDGTIRPQGSSCDIGAFEYIPPTSTTTTTTTTTTVPGPTTTTTTTAPGPTTTVTAPATSPPRTMPSAETRNVLGATPTSAFLGGVVDPKGQQTSFSFQVGTTTAYGLSTVTGTTDVGPLTVETRIAGLKPNTLYHYRLVATNPAGTSYGADRTFRTAPALDGSLKLSNSTLAVHGGHVFVRLTCASKKACVLRFSITVAARLAHTRKLGTLSFTKSTTTLKTVPPHRTVSVSTGVNPAALALLQKASHHQMTGKFSTRPRTNQLGIISVVKLVLR